MLLRAEQSTLLLIDIQEKLLPAIADGEAIAHHSAWLLQLAHKMQVPVIATEQYPRGLGPTIAELRTQLATGKVLEKLFFSAVADGALLQSADSHRSQWVVAGMEAHVCVLQTVLELLDAGQQVCVVAEAIGSRQASDKQLALQRMHTAGAVIVSREMVAFEWLRQAGTLLFKQVSQTFIR